MPRKSRLEQEEEQEQQYYQQQKQQQQRPRPLMEITFPTPPVDNFGGRYDSYGWSSGGGGQRYADGGGGGQDGFGRGGDGGGYGRGGYGGVGDYRDGGGPMDGRGQFGGGREMEQDFGWNPKAVKDYSAAAVPPAAPAIAGFGMGGGGVR
jgi:hypothetical protein